MTTTKKAYGFRLSKQAESHLNKIVDLTGMTKTAAVELSIAKLSQLLKGAEMNNSLRSVLIATLERAARGIESIVIEYADGTYESAPKSSFEEYTRNDPEARIAYTVKSLNEFGNESTTDDIPEIVDNYILPTW